MNILARLVAPALLLMNLDPMANAESLATQCGPVVRSTVKTTTATFTFHNEVPHVTVPNTTFNVSVPEGEERCVILTFSASARCPNACFVTGLVTNGELDPFVSNRFAQANVFRAQSFQWVKRIGAGAHTVLVEINTGNSSFDADIGPYTARLVVTE